MELDVNGDVALVTASSSGLGKASAKALAREGADVVVNGRDEVKLEKTVAELDATGPGEVVGYPADLTVRDEIEALVEQTVVEFGRLDHLVTSSGGPPSGPFMDISDETWYDAYDLLVMSVVRVVRAAAPHLCSDGGGTITTLTSTSVKEALDDLVLSNSVRMSVIGLEKTLSKEFAPDVRVNAVLPGGHQTQRTEDLIQQGLERGDFDSYEEGLEHWTEGVPLERIGDPDELGNLVAFLASPRAGFINGVAIPVDGGSMASNL